MFRCSGNAQDPAIGKAWEEGAGQSARLTKALLGVRPEDLTLHRLPGRARAWAIIETVQPMGALSCAVLRIPGGKRPGQGRADAMAAIGPDDVYDRDQAVWLAIRAGRFSLFDQESGG